MAFTTQTIGGGGVACVLIAFVLQAQFATNVPLKTEHPPSFAGAILATDSTHWLEEFWQKKPYYSANASARTSFISKLAFGTDDVRKMANKARPMRGGIGVTVAKTGEKMHEGDSLKVHDLTNAVAQGSSLAFGNKITMKSRKLALLAR